MRKLYIIIAMIVAIAGLVSCNSDDDSTENKESSSLSMIVGTYTGNCVYKFVNKNDTIPATWTISNNGDLTISNLPVKSLLGNVSDSTIAKTVDETETVTITGKVAIYHANPIAFHVAVNPITTAVKYNDIIHNLRIDPTDDQINDNGGMYDSNQMIIGIVLACAYADGSNTNLLSRSADFQLIGKKGNSQIIIDQ